jgi:hypothetical protein
MRTVEQEQVANAELGLPPSVQAALGELVNAAKDGLLALSVGGRPGRAEHADGGRGGAHEALSCRAG